MITQIGRCSSRWSSIVHRSHRGLQLGHTLKNGQPVQVYIMQVYSMQVYSAGVHHAGVQCRCNGIYHWKVANVNTWKLRMLLLRQDSERFLFINLQWNIFFSGLVFLLTTIFIASSGPCKISSVVQRSVTTKLRGKYSLMQVSFSCVISLLYFYCRNIHIFFK